jgi:hypothetical protein
MNRFRRSFGISLTISAILFALCPAFGRAQSPATPTPPSLKAKFDGNLSTKSSKVGDTVTARTLIPSKLKDGTDLPKGSKILGKVVAVLSKDAGGGTSALAIKFDHLEVKGGATLPIQGQIIGIAPVPDPSAEIDGNSPLSRAAESSQPLSIPQGIGRDPAEDDKYVIPPGSTMKGVTLVPQLDDVGASELRGEKKEIKLDSYVLVKVALK